MSKTKQKVELSKAFKRVFDCEDGQEVLYALMKHCNFFEHTFQQDPNYAAYELGKKNLISYILMCLETDPQQIIKNAKRQREKEKQYDEFT